MSRLRLNWVCNFPSHKALWLWSQGSVRLWRLALGVKLAKGLWKPSLSAPCISHSSMAMFFLHWQPCLGFLLFWSFGPWADDLPSWFLCFFFVCLCVCFFTSEADEECRGASALNHSALIRIENCGFLSVCKADIKTITSQGRLWLQLTPPMTVQGVKVLFKSILHLQASVQFHPSLGSSCVSLFLS